MTKNALIEQALEEYFEPEIRHDRDVRLLAWLDRFGVRQGEIERDVALLSETLGQFVLYWLTRTVPIPEGEREIAHVLGQRRFDYFIDQVARKVRRGGGIGSQFGPAAEVSSSGWSAALSED